MIEVTAIQEALIKAIQDFTFFKHLKPEIGDLRQYPLVKELDLTDSQILAEAKNSNGLLMIQKGRFDDSIKLAHKGYDYVKQEELQRVSIRFYEDKPKPEIKPKPETKPKVELLAWQKGDKRYLDKVEEVRAVGDVFKSGDIYMVVTAHSKNSFYLSQQEIDDNDDFDLEGKEVIYTYYRPATNEQIVAFEEVKKEREAKAKAEAERKAARTPKEVALEEPMGWESLFAMIEHKGKSIREYPKGVRFIYDRGDFGCSNRTLVYHDHGISTWSSHNQLDSAHHSGHYLEKEKFKPEYWEEILILLENARRLAEIEAKEKKDDWGIM